MHGPAAQGNLELVSLGSYGAIDGTNYQTLVRDKEGPRDIPVPAHFPVPAYVAPRVLHTVVVPKNHALNYPEDLNASPAVRELLAVGQVQHDHKALHDSQCEARLVAVGVARTGRSVFAHKMGQERSAFVAVLTASEDVVRAALAALQQENAVKLHAHDVKTS